MAARERGGREKGGEIRDDMYMVRVPGSLVKNQSRPCDSSVAGLETGGLDGGDQVKPVSNHI